MKKILFSFALILSNLFAFSQTPKDAVSFEDPNFGEYLKTRKVPIVKGKISNISSEEIKNTEISYTIVTVFGGAQEHKNAIINADGNFTLELETSLPYQQIWLRIGKEKFYAGIYAHSDLFIEIDWQKTSPNGIYMIGDGVKYLGSDGELNTYMNKSILFKKDFKDSLSYALADYIVGKKQITPYDKFIVIYDNLFYETKKIDSAFINNNPSKYSWIVDNERLSDYYKGICSKSRILQKGGIGIWRKVIKHKSYITSGDGIVFYKQLHSLISNNECYPRNSHDIDFLMKYYCQNDRERKELNCLINLVKNTPPQDSALYKSNTNKQYEYTRSLYRDAETRVLYPKLMAFIDSAFSSSKADFLKLQDDWQREDIQIRKKKTEIALNTMKTGWCKDILTSEYQKTLNKIKEVDDTLSMSPKATTTNNIGELLLETSFGAKLYEVKSGKGTELLANLKSSFKGKALLLDFWGTWCAPCLAEMPISKKLHEETIDLPLEYIYLCTSNNSSIEKWKNKVAELSIPGTHIFVDEKIENELMGMFQASGYPSYRFIDSKGKYKLGAISRIKEMDKVKLKKLVEGK